MRPSVCIILASVVVWPSVLTGLAADNDPFSHHEPPPLVGCWDLKVRDAELEYPSWLEVEPSGYRILVGNYVGRFGSVRPISRVDYENGHFRFVVPPQWEHRTNDIVVEGRLEGDVLRGETTDDKGRPIPFEGHRAPSLARPVAPKWAKPINLFNGRDLAGWRPRNANVKNGWQVRDGLLSNVDPGNDLVTERQFTDFKLHAEFRYPKGSNSGLYLRGRYEVQIEDDSGQEPESHRIGGVYGFLAPRVHAEKRADEWQTMDITLVGRVVTVVLNGEPIIERQTIPGITGGALDSDEDKPGPLLVQGDHGQIDFRKLVLTPGE